MKKLSLFDNRVELGISELSDGNMRAFSQNDLMEVFRNQYKLGQTINLAPDSIARLKTIYQDRQTFTTYYEITPDNLQDFSIQNPEPAIPTSDGLVTRHQNIGLLLPLADCLGMVVFDARQHILGLLHAGRHNVEQYGPQKFIEYFYQNFHSSPQDLLIYFSPCAQNYQIAKLDNQKLPDAAKAQLLSCGIPATNITNPNIDTVSDPNFPSCSNGDQTQRFAVIVKQV